MTAKLQDIALSYDRFSSLLQADGDSEDRQNRAYAAFCERHQLQPAKEMFIDRGVSGFRGAHRKKGALGRLIEIAKTGVFRPKKGAPRYVLVVEAWDRLGRLRPDKQMALISELLRSGLKIGVCRLDDIFTEADFGTHKFTTLSVFVQLAYQESKQKSERVAASWSQRKKKARESGELATGKVPAWLTVVNGKARVIPERVAVIKQIFDYAIAGYGHTKIVQALNDKGIAAFGEKSVSKNRRRSQFSGVWTRPYVKLILNDRRVLGEFQPMKFVEEDDQLLELPDGPVIPNYYPAIITEADFLLARKAQETRRTYGLDKLKSRQRTYINVFARLLRHAADGEGFTLHNKGSKAKPLLILVNHVGNSGRGPTVTFPYPIFERAILSGLKEVSAKELAPRAEVPNPLDALEARLQDLALQIASLKADLRKGYSAAITEVIREQEAEQTRLQEEKDKLQAEQANPLANDWEKFGSLAEALDSAKDPMDTRIRLQTIVSRAVKAIHLLILHRGADLLCEVQVDFHANGVRREYLIRYRTAGFRREGFWQMLTVSTHDWLSGFAIDRKEDLGNPDQLAYHLGGLESICDPKYLDTMFKQCERQPIP
jgi:DNA invertase Pin-like site-specific DNA recombinase